MKKVLTTMLVIVGLIAIVYSVPYTYEESPYDMDAWEYETGKWWYPIDSIQKCKTIITPYGAVDVDGLSRACYILGFGFCEPSCL